jgi:hypothetical protein
MSPTLGSRYEWATPPWRELERAVGELQTPSFRASPRLGLAPATHDRPRYPWQGPATEEPCEGKLSCTVLKASGGPRGPSLSHRATRSAEIGTEHPLGSEGWQARGKEVDR